MADELENHTLALLREIRAEMRERFDRLETEIAAVKGDLAAHRAETNFELEEVKSSLAMHRLETNRDMRTMAVSSLDTLQAIRQLRKHLNLAEA